MEDINEEELVGLLKNQFYQKINLKKNFYNSETLNDGKFLMINGYNNKQACLVAIISSSSRKSAMVLTFTGKEKTDLGELMDYVEGKYTKLTIKPF